MKKKFSLFIIAFILLFNVQSFARVVYPEPTKTFYVNDFADVIDSETEQNITSVNLRYEKTKERPQIVVVTVDSLQGLDEKTYAVELFKKWEIGNKEYNNGLLILLAIKERRIKIETGYGLEGAITDAQAGRILDSSTGYLSSGDYSRGIESIFLQLANKVNEEYGYNEDEIFDNIDNSDKYTSNNNDTDGFPNILKIIFIIILIIIFNGFGGGRGRRRRNGFYVPPTIFRGGGGFGGGGGFSGGGGGSFGGGGSSGGGGAGRGF